ncbi:MAG TPA: lipoprotein signal peptidase [Gammaproteobacteria bacterium]|nr:lipoprotein signal peptidase [Gammaproteobacteria bacterium]
MYKVTNNGLRWLWITALVVVFDQWSKHLADTRLAYGVPNEIFPGFNLTLAYNRGASWGFLHGASGWQRWLFVGLTVFICVVLINWLRRLPADARWLAASFTFIIGGALGNVWDRLQLGYVVDFIQVVFGSWPFPTFNIADSAISIGAVMLIIDYLRGGYSRLPADAEQDQPHTPSKGEIND